jgi:site-specific recombinase XerD
MKSKLDHVKLQKVLKKYSVYLMVEHRLMPKTVELYTKLMAKVLKTLNTLTPSRKTVVSYVLDLYSKEYSSTHLRNIQLAVENYMTMNKTKVQFKRPKKKHHLVSDVLSEAEVAVLIASTRTIREKAIISLLACSGIRNNELCSVKVKDVDMAHNLIRVENGKGGSADVCYISGECVAVLTSYLYYYPREQSDFLFTTLRANKQYTTWALRRLVKKVTKNTNIGKRVFPHKLRHSLATNLLNRGANPRTVQWQLRHKHLSTTLIYLHSGYGFAQREIAHFQPAYL